MFAIHCSADKSNYYKKIHIERSNTYTFTCMKYKFQFVSTLQNYSIRLQYKQTVHYVKKTSKDKFL